MHRFKKIIVKIVTYRNQLAVSFAFFCLSISGIGFAHANTTDLTLKKAPIVYPDGEAIALETNKGEFILQSALMTEAASNFLYEVKKGACLTVTSQGVLSSDANILKITKCKR